VVEALPKSPRLTLSSG